jgi:Ca2+-binding RTX toxin-like protein
LRAGRISGVVAVVALTVGLSPVAATPAQAALTCNRKTATAGVTRASAGGITLFVGTPGNDVIIGTPGDDWILGMGGNDTICGEAGNDIIYGDDGKSSIFANDNDWINGGPGNDIIYGERGNDTLQGGDGKDTIDGGFGFNTLSYAYSTQSVFANNGMAQTWNSDVDSYKNIQEIVGSSYNDYIVAPLNGYVYGKGGNDMLWSLNAPVNGRASYLYGGAGVNACQAANVNVKCADG